MAQQLRIHKKREERPGDTPRDVYETEKQHLTMQHVVPVVDSVPLPPAVPEEMRKQWDDITYAMGATGMLSPTDLPILETAFLAMHLQEQASRTLQREGVTVFDSRGNAIPHPAIAIMKNSAETILKCSKSLNWDINTRLRTPIPDRPTTNPNDPARLLTS